MPRYHGAAHVPVVAVSDGVRLFLRWLVRNRQKRGIKKRYHEEVEALEAAGIEPEPLAAAEERPGGGG